MFGPRYELDRFVTKIINQKEEIGEEGEVLWLIESYMNKNSSGFLNIKHEFTANAFDALHFLNRYKAICYAEYHSIKNYIVIDHYFYK